MKKSFVFLAFIVLLATFVPVEAGYWSLGEPGPDFGTWIPSNLNNTSLSFEPKGIIKKRIYYNPQDSSFWGYILASVDKDAKENVILKVWNIRRRNKATDDFNNPLGRFGSFFYRDPLGEDNVSQVKSALWFGDGWWVVGDNGRLPHYTDKSLGPIHNLVITIFYTNEVLLEMCKQGQGIFRLYSPDSEATDCHEEPSGEEIYISIPAYRY